MSQGGALTAFEVSIREALAFAQARRKSIGLPPADQQVRKKKDGTRLVGPDRYKVTLFLTPWHYADLIHYKQKRGLKYGLNKIIEQLIEERIEHVAARPEKAKTAAQASRGAEALRALRGSEAKKKPAKEPAKVEKVTPIESRRRTQSAYLAALQALDAKTG